MRDESYEAGYRAGHLQGWLDAMANTVPTSARMPDPVSSTPTTAALTSTPEAQTSTPSASPASAWQAVGARTALPAPLGAARARMPVFQEPPVESPAEQQARREKRDRQNINTTLYVASLLLVAAAALFVGTNLSPLFRFVGVCVVTLMFYGAGFVLFAKVPRLKPAAVSFAGTGLALIPVCGLAMYNFALQDGPIAWFITSLLGLAAYVIAAIRLESRVLAYLSLTFVVSSTWSGVSVLGGALVWYFTAFIGLAVLLTALALIRPASLPSLFVGPLMHLHPLVVPAVALSVTLVPLLLNGAEYALVMSLCGAYLALMAVMPGRFQLMNFYGARAAFSAAGAVGTWYLTDRPSWAFLAAAALLAAQALAVAIGRGVLSRWFGRNLRRWNNDAILMFSLQLVTTLLSAISLSLEPAIWGGVAVPAWLPLLASLTTGMILAIRLRGSAEWMPVAALVTTALLIHQLSVWQLVAFTLLATLFWAVRALQPGPLRSHFVLAARLTGTIAVPIMTWALTIGSPQLVAALVALSLALICQQLVSAELFRKGISALAPDLTLAGLALAGILTLWILVLNDQSEGRVTTGIVALVQLGVSCLIGSLLLHGIKGTRHLAVGEIMPIAVAAAVLPLAFISVSLSVGNGGLLLTAAYFASAALRLHDIQHRWAYCWLLRASSTTLVLTAFEQLRGEAGAVVIAGENLTPATVAILALGLQLVFPLVAEVRRRAPAAVTIDAGGVLGLQALTLVLLSTAFPAQAGGWQGTFAAVVLALSAAATGHILRNRAPAALLAPLILTVLLFVGSGNFLNLELVLAIFAVYSGTMIAAVEGRQAKGAYLIGVRVLTAALAAVLSYDITASASVVSVTLALVLAAQHAVQWVMRNRLSGIAFQQAAVWVALTAQAVLPVQFLLQGSPLFSAREAGLSRWIVVLELVLLLVSAVIADTTFRARGAAYLAVYAGVFGIVVLGPLLDFAFNEPGADFLAGPVLSHDGVPLVLLALAILAAGTGILLRQRAVATWEVAIAVNRAGNTRQAAENVDGWLWLAAAGTPALTAWALSPLAAGWIAGVAVLVLSLLCFVASHLERLAALYIPAAAGTLVGATVTMSELLGGLQDPWGSYVPWLAGCGLAGAALYAARWTVPASIMADPVRRWSMAVGGITGIAAPAALGLGTGPTSWTAVSLVAALAVLLWLEVPATARRTAAELGALAVTGAVQRAVLLSANGSGSGNGLDRREPFFRRNGTGLTWESVELDPFWTAQWYVVLAVVLAVLRYGSGQSGPARLILAGGAALLSLSGVGIIFGGTAAQQLWVLVLMALLLLAGLVRNQRLFVWWGTAGVGLCIMWAMRQYTFALLALIGVALIAFALWRLNRTKPAD